jgi:hypothetical protein
MRYSFDEIFKRRPSGKLEPRHLLSVNGVIVGPGIQFGPNDVLGGVSFHLFRGRDIEATERDGVLVVRGIYAP